jgi:hypothetical protein
MATTARRMEGGLFNRLMETSKQPHPEVGMGATIIMYTDRRAATVAVLDLAGGRGEIKSIFVREDKAIRTDGNKMSESQSYRYEPDPTAPLQQFTLRRNGCWVRKGESSKEGTTLMLGNRDAYHDYSF